MLYDDVVIWTLQGHKDHSLPGYNYRLIIKTLIYMDLNVGTISGLLMVE